jgi:hypothetical protein
MPAINRELEIHSTARSLVASYQEGTRLLTQAFGLLQRAEDHLNHTCDHPNTLPYGHSRTVCSGDLKRIIAENKRATWQRIIRRLDLQNLMSHKRYKAVQEQIKAGDVPELTLENLQGFIRDLSSNMNKLLRESVVETFNWLRPGKSRQSFKTNAISKVGPKVIQNFMVEYQEGLWWRIRDEQRLVSMDNVFHLLDGRGFVKYPGNLVARIEDTMRRPRDTFCETEYFQVSWYKKGTLHIVFKRDDLRAELNRIGAAGKPFIG